MGNVYLIYMFCHVVGRFWQIILAENLTPERSGAVGLQDSRHLAALQSLGAYLLPPLMSSTRVEQVTVFEFV